MVPVLRSLASSDSSTAATINAITAFSGRFSRPVFFWGIISFSSFFTPLFCFLVHTHTSASYSWIPSYKPHATLHNTQRNIWIHNMWINLVVIEKQRSAKRKKTRLHLQKKNGRTAVISLFKKINYDLAHMAPFSAVQFKNLLMSNPSCSLYFQSLSH